MVLGNMLTLFFLMLSSGEGALCTPALPGEPLVSLHACFHMTITGTYSLFYTMLSLPSLVLNVLNVGNHDTASCGQDMVGAAAAKRGLSWGSCAVPAPCLS